MKQSLPAFVALWIARNLSSGADSRDPLARSNDGALQRLSYDRFSFSATFGAK